MNRLQSSSGEKNVCSVGEMVFLLIEHCARQSENGVCVYLQSNSAMRLSLVIYLNRCFVKSPAMLQRLAYGRKVCEKKKI